MKTTDCRHTQREIDSNELNQQLSDISMTHISACLPCRELLERSSSLRTLVASLGSVSAPPDFDMRLRARLATERKSNVTWINFLRQTPGVPATALAFSLLVIITLAVFMRSSDPSQLANAPQAIPSDVTRPVNSGVGHGESSITPRSYPVEAKIATADVISVESINKLNSSRRITKPHIEQAAFTSNPGPPSRDFGVDPALTVNRNGAANSTSPVVSLSAPAQPVVVSLRDNNGITRTISLPPVSFGSQRLGYQSETLASSGKGAW